MTADTETGLVTRRRVLGGGIAVTAPAIASARVGATDSGDVELTWDGSVPDGTQIDVTVHEDVTGDGTADNSHNRVLNPAASSRTYRMWYLEALAGDGAEYWIDIEMESDEDNERTPELHSLELVIPRWSMDGREPGNEDTLGIWRLWDNPMVFITTTVLAGGAIGLASKSLAVASLGAYLLFAYLAISTGIPLLTNILYVTLVLVFVGFGFKIWRLEGVGGGSGA